MKKLTMFIFGLCISSFAMAQESDNSFSQNKDIFQKIKITSQPLYKVAENIQINTLENFSIPEKDLETTSIAVSNNRKLKMLHVASTLFFTYNSALT